jgi:CheY-like chemotaxis protein
MRFLVIDDEPLVRRSLARALRARGFESTEAVDGQEGLRLWQDSQPDGVFVDVLMPGLSGPEVVRLALGAKYSRGETPIIALISAFSGEDSEKLAHDCGADCFIAKPFEDIFTVVDQLAEMIKNRRSSQKGL